MATVDPLNIDLRKLWKDDPIMCALIENYVDWGSIPGIIDYNAPSLRSKLYEYETVEPEFIPITSPNITTKTSKNEKLLK